MQMMQSKRLLKLPLLIIFRPMPWLPQPTLQVFLLVPSLLVSLLAAQLVRVTTTVTVTALTVATMATMVTVQQVLLG
ncbi:MAG: hypothetical protein CMI67_13290 [Pelagibaca sp.]|nr:hypothetical protein [Pelagibaca sp.]